MKGRRNEDNEKKEVQINKVPSYYSVRIRGKKIASHVN